MFAPHNPRTVSAYQRIKVETTMHTVDKHQIVSLLFDGLLESLGTARGALARHDIAAKCAAVSKALRILQEGLTAGLDKVDGGQLASNLEALYDYCANRLIMANAKNDDAIFQEVQQLIEPIAMGWKEIARPAPAPQVEQAHEAAETHDVTATMRASVYSHMAMVGA
jgi:flagellar secretion chaperone FliS